MTSARTHANEVGSPSLPQLLLDALLRLFVELVQNVVATLWLKLLRPLRDWHTETAETSQPAETTDPTKDHHAVQPDRPIALMLSSTQSVRPSKHERVLTIVSHTSPSPSVSLAPQAIHPPPAKQVEARSEGELPPPVEDWGRWIARPCAQDGGGFAPDTSAIKQKRGRLSDRVLNSKIPTRPPARTHHRAINVGSSPRSPPAS